MEKRDKQEELLNTLRDFTSKDNWDNFFSIRGGDDSFEWYAEWPQLKDTLISHLSSPLPTESIAATTSNGSQSLRDAEAQINIHVLVPGCGNSRLSEHLYDAGFRNITNIDFSKVVISDMLRRNVRSRPEMRWRVMDMTSLQFIDESIDAVLDKGGLDALMEPELGPNLGSKYLSEVKRVLKFGGKFICLTLAESHVLGLLFLKFHFGWKMSVHAISQKPSKKPSGPSLQTFMVVAVKENSAFLHRISSSFNYLSIEGYKDQVHGLCEALERENKIRAEYSSGSDILYSLEDLKLGSEGNLTEFKPSRRMQLALSGPGSRFFYRAVLLDARQQSDPFVYDCGVFLVPKTRAHEWLFSSEEGQWLVVESSKAARLIMVWLDSSHSNASMDDIQKDLSPLVKQLAPGENDSGSQIPFMAASDGIKQRKILHQVTSSLTGPIIIDEVVYEKVDTSFSSYFPSKDLIFRRLTFQRTENLVQSEALLTREGSQKILGGREHKKTHSSYKSRKHRTQKRFNSVSLSGESQDDLKVDHNCLASSYHTGVISGFMLISSYLESAASSGGTVNVVVIGLGAGLLPMFLHKFLPFLHTEVVELDPVVLELAKDYFGFKEDNHLKVHVTDGIQFVREVGNSRADCELSPNHGKDYDDDKGGNKIGILIVDVDSSDSSSGMTCPAPEFVEETFLLAAKNYLSQQGLFIVNLVSRSTAIKDMVFSRMKVVFNNIFSLQLEEDVNEVVFALNLDIDINDCLPEACYRVERLLNLKNCTWSQTIIEASKKIKRLS